MDLRSLQKPLKEQYRNDPSASRITIRAKGAQTDAPVSCSVDLGRAIYRAEAHKGSGRSWRGRLFRRPLAWCTCGLRADHLSDGGRCDGDTDASALKLPWKGIWIFAALSA